jgi:hypothetical protein
MIENPLQWAPNDIPSVLGDMQLVVSLVSAAFLYFYKEEISICKVDLVSFCVQWSVYYEGLEVQTGWLMAEQC